MERIVYVLYNFSPNCVGGDLGLFARQENERLGNQRGKHQIVNINVLLTKHPSLLQAYLVLRERENAGLEPLSKDFVDPAKILAHLPSDEELEEAGVVINI